MNAYAKPLPAIDANSRPFWEALRAGEIRLPFCEKCRACSTQFEKWCPACGHDAFEWRRMEGRGTVWSYCVFHREYFRGFDLPYNVALVELAEGPRLITNVVEIDAGRVAIGMPVEAVFRPVTPEVTLLLFRPGS